MALSGPQQQVANQLYQLALSRGLSPTRAREFVAAAYAESGLNPRATNRSSGAAGLYQLLSSGYRSKAQSLGGLYDPRANALAILPNYQSYWRQHPGAAPGEAGRDVERSGMGAGFYSRPLGQLGQFGGTPAGPPPTVSPGPGAAAPASDPQRAAILNALMAGRRINFLNLPGPAQPSGPGVPPPTRGGAPSAPAASAGGYPLARRGKLIGLPYQGTHTLYKNWESDRAVDIAVPAGTPVYATVSGVIGSQIGPLGGGDPRLAGNRLHLVGGGDEFYYAHLSRLAVHAGQRVKKGQLLGYSGSANGTAHLHFASRNRDPRTYLGGH